VALTGDHLLDLAIASRPVDSELPGEQPLYLLGQ
jgi:hypothetical protein